MKSCWKDQWSGALCKIWSSRARVVRFSPLLHAEILSEKQKGLRLFWQGKKTRWARTRRDNLRLSYVTAKLTCPNRAESESLFHHKKKKNVWMRSRLISTLIMGYRKKGRSNRGGSAGVSQRSRRECMCCAAMDANLQIRKRDLIKTRPEEAFVSTIPILTSITSLSSIITKCVLIQSC